MASSCALFGSQGDDSERPDEPARGDEESQEGEASSPSRSDLACSFSYWPDPDRTPASYRCSPVLVPGVTGFQCDCDGQQVANVMSSDCDAALRAACGVDPTQPGFCEVGRSTTCWGNAEGYRCRCSEESELVEIGESDCRMAGFLACSESCENASLEASCGPSSQPFRFDCQCARGDFTVSAFECSSALAEACAPRCAHGGGECFEEERELLECRCSEAPEASVRFTYDELGHEDCYRVLEELCGPPPVVECESSVGASLGSCEFGEEGYRCTCSTPEGDSAFARDIESGYPEGSLPSQATCLEELRSHCPQAFDD